VLMFRGNVSCKKMQKFISNRSRFLNMCHNHDGHFHLKWERVNNMSWIRRKDLGKEQRTRHGGRRGWISFTFVFTVMLRYLRGEEKKYKWMIAFFFREKKNIYNRNMFFRIWMYKSAGPTRDASTHLQGGNGDDFVQYSYTRNYTVMGQIKLKIHYIFISL